MIMDPIKEALTFDDVTLAPNYSEVLPSEVNTKIQLSRNIIFKNTLVIFSYGYSYRVENGNINC